MLGFVFSVIAITVMTAFTLGFTTHAVLGPEYVCVPPGHFSPKAIGQMKRGELVALCYGAESPPCVTSDCQRDSECGRNDIYTFERARAVMSWRRVRYGYLDVAAPHLINGALMLIVAGGVAHIVFLVWRWRRDSTAAAAAMTAAESHEKAF